MTTENDLIDAIKETLQNDGTLGKFKSKMRTKIMEILNSLNDDEKPEQPEEILLLNELIREYLAWSGYKYAESVFIQETGLSRDPMSRTHMLEELGVYDSENSCKYPVLYGIVAAFRKDMTKDK